MSLTLAEIKNNESVQVSGVLSSKIKVKLLEMGFVKGKILKVLYRAPLGDPIAVDIEGYVLSLRKDEARSIHVDKIF